MTTVAVSPYLRTRDLLADIDADSDSQTVESVIEQLQPIVDGLIRTEDESPILDVRHAIETAIRRLSSHDETIGTAAALSGLRRLDHSLRTATNHIRGKEVRKRDDEIRRGLRDKIFALLSEPKRPSAIADELGCARSQVSRAIRELIDRKLVEEREDLYDPDGRARYYQLKSHHPSRVSLASGSPVVARSNGSFGDHEFALRGRRASAREARPA